MTTPSHQAAVGQQAQHQPWGRLDTVLFVLVAAALTLVAVQFALAGLGAFTMNKNLATPTDHAYGPHMVVGLIIAALTVLILAVSLADREARGTAGRCAWRRRSRGWP
jgi:hypothetical protein